MDDASTINLENLQLDGQQYIHENSALLDFLVDKLLQE